MKNGIKHLRVGVVVMTVFLALLTLIAPGTQAAEKYPVRPIQVVFGFAPGVSDLVVGVLTDKLQEVLGQRIAFVYKAGAAGSVGASFVAKSKPDGYTLMGASMGPLITSPITMKGLEYSLDDFAPICLIAAAPGMLVVKSDSPYQTLPDMIREAKKLPGKITYATSGVYGTNHIPLEMMQNQGGFSMTHVPTTGGSLAISAVLGGHVDFTLEPISSVSPHVKSGGFRPLAIIWRERLPEFPNVPTLAELGFPIFYTGWFSLVGPKGMPKEVMQTLSTGIDKAVQTHRKAMEDQLAKLSLQLGYLNADEFGKKLRSDYDITKKIFEELSKSQKGK